MRELGLFEQYLLALRQEMLQTSHAALVGGITAEDAQWARIYAHQAELIQKLITAIRALDHDAGQFIKEYCK